MPGPHYGGPHSDWPYPTSDPNPSQTEMHAQAGEILHELKTASVSAVARSRGISRQTLYNRLALITGQNPSIDLVRMIHLERLENMFESLQGRLDGEISNADYGRITAEQRQVLARQSALLKVEASAPEPPPADEQPDNWVDGARAEADAELAEVEHEMRNGRLP